MINRVTFQARARIDKSSQSGKVSIVAMCQVNGKRVVIPLSIYVEEKFFDNKKGLVRRQQNGCDSYNSIIKDAEARAAKILADANEKGIRLDRDTFRARFTEASSEGNFVKFWENELEERRGSITHSTYRVQKASLTKFKQFKKSLPFYDLTKSTVHDYHRFLVRRGDNITTQGVALKIFKTYVRLADMRGHQFKDPFKFYRVPAGNKRKAHLKLHEQHKLWKLYESRKLSDTLQNTLCVFLTACITSLRDSDLHLLKPNWVIDNCLVFKPKKTQRYDKTVQISLTTIAKSILLDFFSLRKIDSNTTLNDNLKVIAAKAQIEKTLTMHMARHTFGTTFIKLGGNVFTLKLIMGHARIETTLDYVHMAADDDEAAVQMKNFDKEFSIYAIQKNGPGEADGNGPYGQPSGEMPETHQPGD